MFRDLVDPRLTIPYIGDSIYVMFHNQTYETKATVS